MKVLMLAYGGWIHSKHSLDRLLEGGVDVIFMDRYNPYPEGHHRYKFIGLPRPGLRYYRRLLGSRFSDRLALLMISLQLRLIWRYFQPDLVHVHWIDERAYHCVKAGVRPLVLSAWGTDINQHFLADADPRRRKIIGQALAGADLVIVDAPDMSEKCAALAGCEVYTELLHIGVDTRAFQPDYHETVKQWRHSIGISDGAKVLLSIRALAARYGHHNILEAFYHALPRLNTEAILVLKLFNHSDRHGPSGYELQLRRLTEQLGITRFVRWMEEVPYNRLPEIYAFADVIINYPSIDAFPVTFLEAAACERPVITCLLPSYNGTFVERYFHVVEPGDVVELTDAIVQFVNQNQYERVHSLKLLSAAHAEVERKYDKGFYHKHLIEMYERLVIQSKNK